MAKQLHKRFPNEQVKSLLQRYNDREIKLNYILGTLGIKRSRFFELLQRYREEQEGFSIAYKRDKPTRKISKELEENILKELSIEDQMGPGQNPLGLEMIGFQKEDSRLIPKLRFFIDYRKQKPHA